MNPRLLKRFLSALGAVALVSGCDLDSKVVQSDDRSAGGSDEIDTRIAVDRTGSPVAAARVALVKAGDSSGTALAVSATGSDGTYPTFVVPDGYYSLLVRDSSGATGRYVDSVRVVSRKLPTGRDTLLSLGSVSGVVRLLSGDSPTSVRLGLVGTDILSSAKSDGTFKIDLVPGGLYTLGAESSLDGYDRIYTRIQLKDGQNLVLFDTLVLPFTGLRVPEGLDAHQDTATGNVRVSWNRVDHPDLMGYVVERVEGGAVTESQFLTDTMWTDSLGAYWEALPLLGPWPDRSVTYRVRSRSVSGAADTRSVAFQFLAKPPHWTRFVGDPTPRLTQDSTTGNVQVTWSAIRHPQLKGYVVDRIENGGVQSGPILVDTTFVDSLGAYWESLPLLGPWPERRLDYRIRLIAKDDGIEVSGDSAAMDATPPAWTKHVDSVKVEIMTDTVSGVSTLKWNESRHPDVVGWTVIRRVNENLDCSVPVEENHWSDSSCPAFSKVLIDSTKNGIVPRKYLAQYEPRKIEFSVLARRNVGASEYVASGNGYLMKQPVVVWRDSGVLSSDISLEVSGSWMIMRSLGENAKVSKNGVQWEELPTDMDGKEWSLTAFDDSLWMVRVDSSCLWVASKGGLGIWSVRSINLPFRVETFISELSVLDGRLTFWARDSNGQDLGYYQYIVDADSISRVYWGMAWSVPAFDVHVQTNGELIFWANAGSSGYLLRNGVKNDIFLGSWRNGYSTYFGSIDDGGYLFEYRRAMSANYQLAAYAVGDVAWTVPLPPGASSTEGTTKFFNGEIWTIIDGHLWKGKLNLPK